MTYTKSVANNGVLRGPCVCFLLKVLKRLTKIKNDNSYSKVKSDVQDTSELRYLNLEAVGKLPFEHSKYAIGYNVRLRLRQDICRPIVPCHEYVLFCSLAVLDTRVGHTMDVLSPFYLCPLSF